MQSSHGTKRAVRSQRSIRWLVTALVVAVAGPVAVAAAVFGYAWQSQARESAEQVLLARANVASEGITQFVAYSERLIRRLADDPRVRDLDASLCGPALPSLHKLLAPTFVSADVWDESGELLCSTLPDSVPRINLLGNKSFAEAIRHEGFRISRVFQEARTQRWSTAFTYPVFGANGKRGIVSALVDLERFREILEGLSLPESTIVTLAERSGVVVARTHGPEELVGTELPSYEAGTAGDTLLLDVVQSALSQEGEEFAWARVAVPGTRWVLFAGLPHKSVYGTAVLRSAQVAGGGLLVLLIAGIVGRLVYRRLTQPLRELVEGLSNARADVARPLPPGGPEEVALVADRFNRAWGELIEANREKERSSERVRSLVDNAVMGICIVTDEGRFIEVNQALVDLLGFADREALLATSITALHASAEHARGIDELTGGAPVFRSIPARWRKLTGEPLNVRLSGRRLMLANGEHAREIIVEDVSEVSRLQTRIAQTEKMEALGRLAGGVAHDFNNLLTIVLGQADLMLEDPTLAPEHQEQVREIYEASNRGAGLNRQLLAFGRGRAASVRGVDLNSILHDSERILRRAVGESIHVELQTAGELHVLADRSQVEQVLLNLVVNARDAMSDGGRLTLRTWKHAVSDDEALLNENAHAGAHVVLAVTDTGVGIPGNVLPHIFEPFFTTKSELRGTGLGLATVYGVVTSAGGHVRIETMIGKGTTFRVYWPRYVGDLDERRSVQSPGAPREREGTILLVEDQTGVHRFLDQVLTKAGYRVTAASDGLEAIQLTTRMGDARFDLLISDIVMPGLGGHEVAARLAEASVIDRALLLSGYPDGLPAEGPSGVAEWSFLAKPCTSNELLIAVRRLLER